MNYIFWASLIALIIVVLALMSGYFTYEKNETCNTKKGEEIARFCLTRIFNKPFPKAHPKWLVNPETGRRLELDCYNKELGVACEYNGEQHYKFPNTFHKSRKEFDAQIRRDEHKRKCCKKENILLIEIPYTCPKDKINEFIKNALKTPQ